MDKFEEVKADIRRGRYRIKDIHWLVQEVESQRETIKRLKPNRSKSYWDIAKENICLEESLKTVREQRDYYKQACEAAHVAL